MRNLKYLVAAAAIGSLMVLPQTSSANPLASGLGSVGKVPTVTDGIVQKVHSWHCRKRWSRRWGWHRHRRACFDDDHHFFGPAFGFGVPFFAFQFFDDDDFHHRRKFRRKHWDWDD